MRMKAVATLLIALILTAGCGYKMTLTGRQAAFTLYPTSIQNVSDEVMSNQIFVNSVKSYLSSINSLQSQDKAEYFATFELTKVKSSAAVKLTSGQTATVDLDATIHVVVKDKDGKTVYNQNLSASSTYSVASANPTSMKNRDNAIKDAVKTAMESFRYGFETR